MTKSFKLFCAATVVAVMLCISGSASAAIISETRTLADWRVGSVTLGDKTFTHGMTSGYADNSEIHFSWSDGGTAGATYGDDMWIVQFEQNFTGPAMAMAQYTVDITAAGIADGWVFEAVDLGVDSSFLSGSVTKETTGAALLTSTNGSDPVATPIVGGLTSITVKDTIDITSGEINSISNAFTQTIPNGEVPEPSTLALWGGLAGLGLLIARRRNRSAV